MHFSTFLIFLLISILSLQAFADKSEVNESIAKSASNLDLATWEDLNVFPERVGRAGVPRFQGIRNKRRRPQKKPSRLGQAAPADGPIRRQDGGGGGGGPGLNVSSVSPLELSLGGLTGLQGLPPLSIIQFVKLLVAVTPFIIPLVFVPILIFTIGMFMIPVKNSNLFFGDPGLLKRSFASISSIGSGLVPSISSLTRSFANHEECIERLTCEIGRRYIPTELEAIQNSGNQVNENPRQETPRTSSSISYRKIITRLLNQLNHPLLRRISRSLSIPSETCQLRKCSPFTFIQKILQLNAPIKEASELNID